MRRRRYEFFASLGAGIVVATAVSVLTIVGSLRGSGDFEAAYGVSVPVALLVNYACGIVGGGLLGVLIPVAGSAVGAALVGALIGAIVLTMLGLPMNPLHDWSHVVAWYGGFGLFGGAYSGILARSMWGQKN